MAHYTAAELAGLRRGLIAFCYQMLGSPFDAEDAAQDVLERAWRARSSFDAERASLATWCFHIARNVCIDRLRQTPRRPLPSDLRDSGLEIGAPLVPALDVPWLMPAPTQWRITSDVETSAELAQDVRLAVTAMLQRLPPRQRGVLVFRDVLGLTAAETGAVFEMSVASVNSALGRARDAIRKGAPRRQPLAAGVVERYARAIERADADGLASLVAEDVVFEMPPVPNWALGREPYRAFMKHLFAWRGTGWSTRTVSANGQHGILLYRGTPQALEPHTLQLFDGDGSGAVEHVLVYQDARLSALFEAEFSTHR
ncbi:RNA polymerase subunit sigma-70 [Paenarthrobacter sp. Z7-10]|uniref:RNA polymerase subunit sigma-70 n=1 Tax=Paenarthrobacter sp. Z7-10 TaxID=2787635 RepID=UPI0022A8FAC1|nr:RNA polymerase subunit sigma-70 [Paenarthrobacter sp. Z7-10]MCZ2404284.1 RNA polymerase subunit sigma-70 [Paenarthrobacter sp. Z7-10]